MRRQSKWRACLSLFRIRFMETLQYRIAALSGASISVFYALIEVIVYTVFFTYADSRAGGVNGLTLAQTVSYIWIGQLLFPLQGNGVDGEILRQIINGDVGIELCRPLDLYAHWFAKSAAGKLGGFWLRAAVIMAVGILIPGAMGLSAPASFAGCCMFLLTAIGAFLFGTAFGMLLTALRLNITWGEGPTNMLALLGGVLSGAYLPLQLWPDAVQRFLLLQPFAGALDIPGRLYVGSMAPADGMAAFLLQLFWIAAFIAIGRMIIGRKLRTLIVQGG